MNSLIVYIVNNPFKLGQTSINNIPNMPHVQIYKITPEKIALEKALKNAPKYLEIKLYEVLRQLNFNQEL